MIRLTFRQMEYFEALAQLRHFGRAAGFVGVTQPALSSQIAEMEDRLGARLFERGARSVELTPEGADLRPKIEAILNQARDLEAAALQDAAPMQGRFRLGIIPTVAPYLLPDLLPRLKLLYPRLSLELRETITEVLLEETALGKLDAAIVATPVERQGIDVEPLFEDPFLLAVSDAELGKTAPPVAPQSRVLERLMLLEEGHCMRDQALAICGEVKPVAIANFAATSLTTLTQMVAHGLGVTLVPQIARDVMASIPGVHLVPFAGSPPSRTVALARRRGAARRAECAALAETIRDIAGSAGGEPPGDQRPHRAQS